MEGMYHRQILLNQVRLLKHKLANESKIVQYIYIMLNKSNWSIYIYSR